MLNDCDEYGKTIDVDCAHEGGKFILCNFPGRHHGAADLFTVRFRAPADYQAGDVFFCRGKELPVLTPGMQSAPAGVFRTGAVVQADIDFACGRAFVGTLGSAGGGSGTESDPVYTADKPSLAPLASPAFTGIPKAPTAPAGTATTQVATTEFVATAIGEADSAPSAAFAMVPDYANQDGTNQMPADGASFTVPADGFVVVSRDGDAAARQAILIDGVEAAAAAGSVSATLPVSADDVVTANGAGWTAGSCFYVPPKYVPVNRQYSTDEQLTGETWIDGRPVWRKTFIGTLPTANAIIGSIGAFSVIVDSSLHFNRQLNNSWQIAPLQLSNVTLSARIAYEISNVNGEVYVSSGTGSTDAGNPFVMTIKYVKP